MRDLAAGRFNLSAKSFALSSDLGPLPLSVPKQGELSLSGIPLIQVHLGSERGHSKSPSWAKPHRAVT